MRTARVFYLFLSVLQFIFFLKLVEYVRGEEIQPTSNAKSANISRGHVSSDLDEAVRGLFVAPNMAKMKQKKRRLWNQTENLSASNVDPTRIGVESPLTGSNQTESSQSKREQFEREVARLCPACENNQCVSNAPISAGFPIVPVIIAIVTGIAWFILFLIAWIFHTRPNTKGQQSGGYDGGYGSSEYGDNDDSEKPSIFDHFLKPHDRSFSSYTRLLHNVLDSIEKLSDLYNSY